MFKYFLAVCSLFLSSFALGQMPRIIDDNIINDPHFREEHGLNSITRPSIEEIFQQLQFLSPLPVLEVPYKIPERMPEDREILAIHTGQLISEGFIAVQSGDMKKVQTIATSLSKYSNAIGAGEKMKGHAARILALTEKQDIDNLKKAIAKTQLDLEKELILLQDIDLAHLISLGGWIRAFEVSSASVLKNFTEEKAKSLFRDDIVDYYEYALNSMNPELKKKTYMQTILKDITALKASVTLKKNQQVTLEDIKKIQILASSLTKNIHNIKGTSGN